MTHQERTAIEQVSTRPLLWRPDADSRFVRLLAGPCPLLEEDTGLCSVYAVRPMNCRRYMCGRQAGEAWTPEAIPLRILEHRDLRRQYARNERQAQRWGRAMGWDS